MASPETRGLTETQAQLRLEAEGENRLPAPAAERWYLELASNLTHLFALLLWAAALLAFLAGQAALSAAILLVVLVNGLFAFYQERKAHRAVEALDVLLPDLTEVVRGGEPRLVSATQLVAGDLVRLGSGDRVPADGPLVGEAVSVEMSSLTGESQPVEVKPGEWLFAGGYLVTGRAEMIVEQTGASTRLGEIAAVTRSTVKHPSALYREMSALSRGVALAALVVGVVIFALATELEMPLSERLVFAVGVIVALVPEGLLPTTTFALALATQRMAKRKAVVKHLSLLESLGEVDFICTDKTGTLTINHMSVIEAWSPFNDQRLLRATWLLGESLTGRQSSAPLEAALREWSAQYTPAPEERKLLLVDTEDFQAERRSMSATYAAGTQKLTFVKGAPELLIERAEASSAEKAQAMHQFQAMSSKGLRVLAVSEMCPEKASLLGLIGISDPPRPEAASAISACRSAGIRVVLITGDSGLTAKAVASAVGLPADRLLEGEQIDILSDDQLLRELRAGAIFARAAPLQKLRITQLLQANHHVVAMTGDGVNDAPALQSSEVGIAMGKKGTDVARQAADVILLDDNFASVVAAIEEGRAVYGNIRRFTQYHFCANVAELACFLAWGISGGEIPLPLVVMQVLAIDLGTDLLPAIALGSEKPSPQVMRESPQPRQGKILPAASLFKVFLFMGPLLGVAALLSFAFAGYLQGFSTLQAFPDYGPTYWSLTAATYMAIVCGQIAFAVVLRSERPFAWNIFNNRLLVYGLSFSLLFMLAVVYLPLLSGLFDASPPPPAIWGWLIFSSLLLLISGELYKWVRR